MFPEMAKVGIQVLTMRSGSRRSAFGKSNNNKTRDGSHGCCAHGLHGKVRTSCQPLAASFQLPATATSRNHERERGTPRSDRSASRRRLSRSANNV